MEVTIVTVRYSRQPNATKRTCIEIIIIKSSIALYVERRTHSPPTPMTTGPAKLRLLSLKRSTVAMPGPPWITISSWLLQRWRRNRIRNYKFIPLKRGVGAAQNTLISRGHDRAGKAASSTNNLSFPDGASVAPAAVPLRSRAILSSRLRLSSRYPEKRGKKKRMNGKIRKEAHPLFLSFLLRLSRPRPAEENF